MLKIEINKFGAMDVITASTPDISVDQTPEKDAVVEMTDENFSMNGDFSR